MSVQSGIVNYRTANEFYKMGARRVVLARELSLEEIKVIRQNTPPDLELEAFCHGAMCVSFSGRCLLSSYMTGRDANRGDCAQPCRWSYALMEETRPGQYFPISEHKEGTYILNADDLYMAPYLDKMLDSGVTSFKIEGRAKSHYYVAAVTNSYFLAKQALIKGEWPLPKAVSDEFEKISHRGYSTGFYFGKPENSQGYKSAGYIRDFFVAAIVEDYKDGMIIAKMKNRFSVGAELDCLEPISFPKIITVNKMYDQDGNLIETANHPEMTVKIPCETPIMKGSLLRIKEI
ncbi:MAG: U32 family peptidase C-terminal domain-containing protein [Oscillospiraceae bacterium]|nr:U32 family peptidase C-terminal domain-containing protein [Candidatus Equicaccousia limihippi]